jgi:hypothetical protein
MKYALLLRDSIKRIPPPKAINFIVIFSPPPHIIIKSPGVIFNGKKEILC